MKRIIIQALFVFSYVFANGQQTLNNSGNLQIHAGAAMTSFGNLSNSSSAVLTNNGLLYVKGSIANEEASMSAGTGTLLLNGTAVQNITGTQSFNTHNLVTNNGAGITLNNNLSITGAHSFAAGLITTSATPHYLVYQAGSSYSGADDTRHVNGWVKKIGTSDFVFPVGNGTVVRTIALSNLSANSEFNVKYFPNTPFSTQMQSPLQDINESEYWAINEVAGGSASVTMNWDNSKVYFPTWIVPDIRVAGYNGSQWVSNGGTASGSAATTGTITSNSISSFNLFVLGSQSYILPLTLISFTANLQDNYTQIGWVTANEYNLERYTVDRSNNGINFYPVTQMTPRNNNNTEYYYTRDYEPIQQVAYYRLRSKDTGGPEHLSKIIAVRMEGNNSSLTLRSNPVHREVTLIATPSLSGIFSYTITAVNGQLVQQGKLPIQNGGVYQLDLNQRCRPGAYTLEVSNGSKNFAYKLIVQ
jgi:hypothetical protein